MKKIKLISFAVATCLLFSCVASSVGAFSLNKAINGKFYSRYSDYKQQLDFSSAIEGSAEEFLNTPESFVSIIKKLEHIKAKNHNSLEKSDCKKIFNIANSAVVALKKLKNLNPRERKIQVSKIKNAHQNLERKTAKAFHELDNFQDFVSESTRLQSNKFLLACKYIKILFLLAVNSIF